MSIHAQPVVPGSGIALILRDKIRPLLFTARAPEKNGIIKSPYVIRLRKDAFWLSFSACLRNGGIYTYL